MLCRFYRVPAHEVLRWSPRELAVNWYVCFADMKRASAAISSAEDGVMGTVQMSPIG